MAEGEEPVPADEEGPTATEVLPGNATKLRILHQLRERRMTAAEVGRRLDLHRSTAHRNLRTLQGSGHVDREDSGRKWVYYRLTAKGRAVAVLGSRLVLGLSLTLGAGSVLALVLDWFRRLPGAAGAPDADGAPAMPAPPPFPVAGVLLAVAVTAVVVALHWYLSPRRRVAAG